MRFMVVVSGIGTHFSQSESSILITMSHHETKHTANVSLPFSSQNKDTIFHKLFLHMSQRNEHLCLRKSHSFQRGLQWSIHCEEHYTLQSHTQTKGLYFLFCFCTNSAINSSSILSRLIFFLSYFFAQGLEVKSFVDGEKQECLSHSIMLGCGSGRPR